MSWFRQPTPGFLAFALFGVLIAFRVATTDPDPPHGTSEAERVTVARVLDGDTFDCTDGRRVRLLGVDAPELSHQGSTPEHFADESTEWLRSRIEGQSVTLKFGPERTDRYRRTLAWIYDTENRLINRDLLAAGSAKLLPDFGLPLELEPELRSAEAEARIARRGLWQR